jgi:hypothetical protein
MKQMILFSFRPCERSEAIHKSFEQKICGSPRPLRGLAMTVREGIDLVSLNIYWPE